MSRMVSGIQAWLTSLSDLCCIFICTPNLNLFWFMCKSWQGCMHIKCSNSVFDRSGCVCVLQSTTSWCSLAECHRRRSLSITVTRCVQCRHSVSPWAVLMARWPASNLFIWVTLDDQRILREHLFITQRNEVRNVLCNAAVARCSDVVMSLTCDNLGRCT